MPSDEPSPARGFLEEEDRVKAHSDAFKKELGLRDLVLTQIVFVVGTSWVGTAAKLGPSQTAYWLFAILLFYLPIAAVIIYLNRIMPLEGGLYQWAKLGFNEFIGFIVAWNLWLLGITVMAGTGLVIATNLSYALGPAAAWLPASRLFVSTLNGVLFAALILVTIRGLSIGKWVHNVGAILLLITYGALVQRSLVAAKQQLSDAVEDLVAVLRAPDVVRSIPEIDRANLAKYLTITKLKLENAIAVVRNGDGI